MVRRKGCFLGLAWATRLRSGAREGDSPYMEHMSENGLSKREWGAATGSGLARTVTTFIRHFLCHLCAELCLGKGYKDEYGTVLPSQRVYAAMEGHRCVVKGKRRRCANKCGCSNLIGDSLTLSTFQLPGDS